jgi:hypothetical protein
LRPSRLDAPPRPAPSQQARDAAPPRQARHASTAPPDRDRASIGRVFVSYRRDDSADVVGRIYDRLAHGFGSDHIFKDVDSIGLGVDFRDHLRRAVDACAVQLVVIGPGWIGAADSTGQRRLDDERDYVRLEIEAALQRNIPVIPVLVRGARVPPENLLPATLAPLAYRNAIEVRADPDFHRDMDRLIGALERMFENQV